MPHRTIATATECDMSDNRLIARPATSTYLVFAFLCLPFALPVVKVATRTSALHGIDVSSDLSILLVFPSFILLMFLWVSRFRILVSDSEVSYRTLFRGTRSLQLSQIASARTEIGVGGLLEPFYRLIITPKNTAPPMIINMKIFSREDLRKLLAILNDNVTGNARLSIFSEKKGG